jgi:hypothetical protein
VVAKEGVLDYSGDPSLKHRAEVVFQIDVLVTITGFLAWSEMRQAFRGRLFPVSLEQLEFLEPGPARAHLQSHMRLVARKVSDSFQCFLTDPTNTSGCMPAADAVPSRPKKRGAGLITEFAGKGRSSLRFFRV